MYTILVIDDNLQNRVLVQRYVMSFGMQCLIAETGHQGFVIAKQLQPDVVVTDVLMPADTWDGYETARQLKADPKTQHIPVIAVTAGGSQIKKHEDNFDAFLLMPLRIDDFKMVLMEVLSSMV